MPSSSLWQRFQRYFLFYRDLDFSLDISRLKLPVDFLEKMQPKIGKAFAAMRELEAGAIANPTENRMVGHYWLGNPALAPTAEIRQEIEQTVNRVKKFAIDADPEDVFHVLRHLASNDPHIRVAPGKQPSEDRFSVEQER